MNKYRTVTYTAVKLYGNSYSRSHVARTRGPYAGPIFGMGMKKTLCGLSAGEKVRDLPADKASCSDCRIIMGVQQAREMGKEMGKEMVSWIMPLMRS